MSTQKDLTSARKDEPKRHRGSIFGGDKEDVTDLEPESIDPTPASTNTPRPQRESLFGGGDEEVSTERAVTPDSADRPKLINPFNGEEEEDVTDAELQAIINKWSKVSLSSQPDIRVPSDTGELQHANESETVPKATVFRFPPTHINQDDLVGQRDGTFEKAVLLDELPFSDNYRHEAERLMDLLPGWYELSRPEHMRYFSVGGEELQVKPTVPKSTGCRGMLKVQKRQCSLGVPEKELLVRFDYTVQFADGITRPYRNAFVMRYINKDWSCWNVGDETKGWPTADKAHDCRFELETEENGRWQMAHLMTRADQRKERTRARYQSWRRDFYFLFGPGSLPDLVTEGWLIYTWPSTQEMPEAADSHPEKSKDEMHPVSGRFNRGDGCNDSTSDEWTLFFAD